MLSELDTKLPLCTMLILMILLVWGPMMVSKQLNVNQCTVEGVQVHEPLAGLGWDNSADCRITENIKGSGYLIQIIVQ